MTQDLADNIVLYVTGTMKDLRQKARFAHENGFHEVARGHENSVQLAESILRELYLDSAIKKVSSREH